MSILIAQFPNIPLLDDNLICGHLDLIVITLFVTHDSWVYHTCNICRDNWLPCLIHCKTANDLFNPKFSIQTILSIISYRSLIVAFIQRKTLGASLFIMFVLFTFTFISTLQLHLNEDVYGLKFNYIISNTANFTELYQMNHIHMLPWSDSNSNANQWIKYIICMWSK